MKRILTIVVVFMLGIMTIQAGNERSVVSVNGQAERSVEPDIIVLKITVNKDALKNKMDIADAETKMLGILKSMGVKTNEKFKINNMGSSTDVGFIKRKNLQTAIYTLELSNALQVYGFIDAVEDLNIKLIEIVKFDVSNKDEIIRELRAEAVKIAKNNAEILSGAVGQKIGKAINIIDRTYNYIDNYRPNIMRAKLAMSEAADAVEPINDLTFENIKLKADVAVEFELE